VSNHINSNVRKLFLAGVLLAGLALLLVPVLLAQEQPVSPRVDKTSAANFKTTVANLEKVLKKQGFMIVAKVDHQNMLSMVGAKIKGSISIEFGKPDMGKMLFPMNPAVGLEMPARLYVYEDVNGKTIVSYYRPSVGFATYVNDMISQAGKMMDAMLDGITNEAVK
jgi:uncharacterized protein (DUF302 family)